MANEIESGCRWLGVLLLASWAFVGCGPEEPTSNGAVTEDAPDDHDDRFVSAYPDTTAGPDGGSDTGFDMSDDMFRGSPGGLDPPAWGDIFASYDGTHIIDINPSRGLLVIDIADLDNPSIIGRLRLDATTVEMHVVDDRAYLIMAGSQRYPNGRFEGTESALPPGQVLAVDLSDLTAPAVVGRAPLDGSPLMSQIVQAGDQTALYVVASLFSYDGCSETALELGSQWDTACGEVEGTAYGFNLTERDLAEPAILDLGARVNAAHASAEALIVASTNEDYTGTHLELVTIDAAGALQPEGSIDLPGFVEDSVNLGYHEGIIRVLAAGPINQLVTVDASDPLALVIADSVDFAEEEHPYDAIFLDDRAFFVTFHQGPHLHAIEIAVDGVITVRNEISVNRDETTFFPLFGGRRLLGVGEGYQGVSISLYDSEDLSSPNPLVARLQLEYYTREAYRDEDKVSVLEDAVSAEGANEVLETGLIVLPFIGVDGRGGSDLGAQLIAFSESTLTPRAEVSTSSAVVHAIVLDDGQVASLGEDELTLFNAQNPDDPEPQGRLLLAPTVHNIFVLADYAIRLVSNWEWWHGWWGSEPAAQVEVVPLDGDIDLDPAISSVSIPRPVWVELRGDHLLSISANDGDNAEATVTVVDLADPTSPTSFALTLPREEPVCQDVDSQPHCLEPSMGTRLIVGVADSVAIVTRWDYPVPTGGGQVEDWSWDRRFGVQWVDLSGAEPSVIGIDVPGAHELVGTFAYGEVLYVNDFVPIEIEGDDRPYASYFVHTIDVSDPADVLVSEPINVPGQVMGAFGDSLFARDQRYDPENGALRTDLVHLRIEDGRAHEVGRHSGVFMNRLHLDEDGRLLAAYDNYRCTFDCVWPAWLSIFEVDEAGELRATSELYIDHQAELQVVTDHTAWFLVWGGVVGVDTVTAEAPMVFLPVMGLGNQVAASQDEIFVAAFNVGILRWALGDSP